LFDVEPVFLKEGFHPFPLSGIRDEVFLEDRGFLLVELNEML
jgi:hypothetical protein